MHLNGIPIVVSEHAMASKWTPPDERFIEYEPKDERWCRYFDIGTVKQEPGCYQIGASYLMHPVIFNQIKKESAHAPA